MSDSGGPWDGGEQRDRPTDPAHPGTAVPVTRSPASPRARSGRRDARPRERLLHAPTWGLLPAVAVVAAYAWQALYLTPTEVERGAFSSAALADGRWWTLLTCLGLHAGLVHAGSNALAAVSFGPAIARRLGGGALPLLGFVLFYLLCGVAGGLLFAALHPGDATPVVGASGAICGLWGGAARLLDPRQRVSPLFGAAVGSQLVGFAIMNLVLVAAGLGLGAAAGVGVRIAWEAHVGGFVAGLLLVRPLLSLSHRRGG